MRFSLVFILLLLCIWSCETKKRRRQNRIYGENQELESSNDSGFGLTSFGQEERNPSLLKTRSSSQHVRGEKSRKNNSRSNKKRNKKSKKNKRKQQNVSNLQEEKRKEILRNTMRHMFGFEHMDAPRGTDNTDLDVEDLGSKVSAQESRDALSRTLFSSLRHDSMVRSRDLPNPPDFMLELYRTYSKETSLSLVKFQSQGDTVRSFFSVAGEAPDQLRDKGKPMIILPYFKNPEPISGAETTKSNSRQSQMRVFAFNVTSIPGLETVVAAELRLNGLRNIALKNQANNLKTTNSSHLEWTAVLAAYKVAKSEENQTRNIYQRLSALVTLRPNSSFSWVDGDIARLTTIARQPGCILIVKFNHFNRSPLMRRKRNANRGILNRSELNVLSSQDSSPILPSYFVVLSDRSKRNSGDRRRLTRPPSLTPILIVYCNDTTTKVTPAASSQSSNDILKTLQSLNVSTNHKRSRRSTGSNTFGDSESSSSDERENELPGEGEHQTSVSRPIQDNDQTELHDNGRSDREVIQSLKDRKSSRKRKTKKRKRGRKCRKRRRKGKKSRKCQKKRTRELNRVQQTCGRKSLNVDFGDMGWEDWIISPKSFDAYYCAGLCQFDTMKKANPSNHAIIQAFINAFEINNEVPAPCCVPDKLMSLSVLYYDKDGNVVLKVFPNMSVKSCACR